MLGEGEELGYIANERRALNGRQEHGTTLAHV